MDDKLKILLCEDDENLGTLLSEYLQAKGFQADLCPDGEVGYRAFFGIITSSTQISYLLFKKAL